MNFFYFHIGDYASATRHLSWDEDLAYRRLIDAYYMRENCLPKDKSQIYRLVVAVTKSQRLAVDSVLVEFFELREEGFFNRRCDEELQCMAMKRSKAKASAETRWRNANAYADAMRTHSEGNATTTQDQEVEEKDNLSVIPKEPKAPRKIGTRVSEDFLPDPSCHALAEDLLLTASDGQQALDNFLDYWRSVPGAKGVKLDWQATFRNWLREVARRKKPNGTAQKPNSIADGFAKVRAVIAEAERREHGVGGTAGEGDLVELSRLRESAA